MKIGSISYRMYLRKSHSNKKNVSTIYCKLIKGNKTHAVSTDVRVPSDAWITKNYSIKETFVLESHMLEAWKLKLHKKLLELYSSSSDIILEDVVFHMTSKLKPEVSHETKGFIEVFKLFNEKAKKLIGKEYSRPTVNKFFVIESAFSDFLYKTYEKKDIPLQKIKLKHLLEYEEYAALVLKHKTATINKTVQRLKQVMKYAIGHDFVEKDPWLLHKTKSSSTSIVYLTKEQLDTLLKAELTIQRLEKVRDCFVFSCYSGLAYAEISSINNSHIVFKNDIPWINMKRKKTLNSILIPMFPPAYAIWTKYNGELPVFSNQKYNAYLKELALEIKIDIHLTTHVARKTFATTVLIGNDIPIKVASALLGHTDSKITEKYYAEVTNDLLEQHITTLFNIFK